MNGTLKHPGKLLISIDFEDFAFDLKRELGLWETGALRQDALWQSYEVINRFLTEDAKTEATFFCTGVIGDQMPDLIARMVRDGHEIACHSHYHDNLDGMNPQEVMTCLRRGQATLQDASGQPVTGFRAPNFRIDKQAPAQYQIVQQLFDYDSSYCTASKAELADFRDKMGLDRLTTLPIFYDRPYKRGPKIKLGGTFLKLFPESYTRATLAKCIKAGIQPHFYLHPYEFQSDGAFCVSGAELAPLGRRKRAYWQIRQNQWHRVGNAGLLGKLQRIVADYPTLGRLDVAVSAANS